MKEWDTCSKENLRFSSVEAKLQAWTVRLYNGYGDFWEQSCVLFSAFRTDTKPMRLALDFSFNRTGAYKLG